jgi:hypothetical protein
VLSSYSFIPESVEVFMEVLRTLSRYNALRFSWDVEDFV